MKVNARTCWRNAFRVNSNLNICGFPRNSYSSLPLLSFDDFKRLCIEGKLQEALHSLHLIPWRMVNATFSIICNNLLQACIKHEDFETSREVYSLIVKHGYETDPFLGTTLIRIHSMHGLLAESILVFSRVQKPDAFTWGALIAAHSKHGQMEQAINLYHEMTMAKFKADSHVFVAVLKACADSTSTGALTHGKLIHFHIIDRGLELAPFINNALINMYGRCSSLEDAHTVFNQSPKKDAVTWSAIIGGYSHSECGPQAFQLFLQMQKEGTTPDQISSVSALKACCGIAAVYEGKMVHTQVIESGFEWNTIISSTLIDMYAKCGNLEDARKVFNTMRKRDVVAWSAMIAGYTFNYEYELALKHYNDMRDQGLKPNEVILLCVLSANSQLGLIDECDVLFKSMRKEFGINPTKEHVNCLVSLFGKVGRLKEAEDMLQRTPLKSNLAGWTSLLNSCKVHGEVEIGKRCFDHLVKSDCREASAYTLMSDIFTAKGRWEDANNIQRMRESAQAWKKPGKAFIHVNDVVHEFVVIGGESSYTSFYNVSVKIKAMHAQMKGRGHVPEQGLELDFTIDHTD